MAGRSPHLRLFCDELVLLVHEHRQHLMRTPKRAVLETAKAVRRCLSTGKPGRPRDPIITKAVNLRRLGAPWAEVYKVIPDRSKMSKAERKVAEQRLGAAVNSRLRREKEQQMSPPKGGL